jgi:aromatic-L-amino-acid/L-tryptophan decarboxylase
MTSEERPLEPGPAGMRAIGERALELLIETIDGLHAAPAAGARPDAGLLVEALRPPPEGPRELGELLEVVERAAAAAYEAAGPGYLAYIPGGGVFTAAVAEMLAAGLNRYTGRAFPAPALVALEQSVLRWICEIFHFPEGSQALLTSGGSMANVTALAAARDAGAEGRVDHATVYLGEHAHGSIAKAARTVGISPAHVRVVRSTPDLRMDVGHLRELVETDRAAGLVPVCVSAAAGTTNTGTVDLLEEVADAARDADLWLHVDGAYGAFFQLTHRGRERLRGIERADSISLDPHKSLFLPYGTGALAVRSADTLRRTFATEADYLQDLGAAGSLPDFDALGPELTRPFRGLRVWLPLHLHGVGAFRAQLDEKLDLARRVYDTLAADDRFEVPWEPDLTVVAFRLADGDDEAQRRFLERIHASRRVLLSSTRIGGRMYLRVAVLSFRTHEERIRELLEIVAEA